MRAIVTGLCGRIPPAGEVVLHRLGRMFPFIASESVFEAVEMAVMFFSLLAAMLGMLVARQA